ncbi:MAG: ribonuclease H-like domain-containing protein [Nitrospirae bacterium]|nr:ribonuclease H-like domain-containing protein [Nitrospirota bacterium]
MPKRVVIDIETVGKDFESLDETSKEYLLKFAETEEQIQEAKESLSFYPLTGEIVAIGMLNADTEEGAVYFQSTGEDKSKTERDEGASRQFSLFKEDKIKFIKGTEREILEGFWKEMKNYDQVITFNGRAFDAPYIITRSAILKIKPTKDLMPNRYSSAAHVDLLDQLTFYGSVRRKFSLHMWCQAFGIPSPKAEGITGHEVKDLFKEGRYLEIARYCARDLYATKALFEYWDKFVKFPPSH